MLTSQYPTTDLRRPTGTVADNNCLNPTNECEFIAIISAPRIEHRLQRREMTDLGGLLGAILE
jgi:hypothetical protein